VITLFSLVLLPILLSSSEGRVQRVIGSWTVISDQSDFSGHRQTVVADDKDEKGMGMLAVACEGGTYKVFIFPHHERLKVGETAWVSLRLDLQGPIFNLTGRAESHEVWEALPSSELVRMIARASTISVSVKPDLQRDERRGLEMRFRTKLSQEAFAPLFRQCAQ